MAIEYFCRGCGHCRIDAPEDIDDGLCTHCQQRRDFPEPKKRFPLGWTFLVIAWAVIGFVFGYKWPRDVELESTKPVYFLLNADAQAAKILVEQCEPAERK